MTDKVEISLVNKFDGNNFHQWKFQMICALKAKGIYNVVTGAKVKPAIDPLIAETLINAEQWDKQDAMAMFTLTSAMDYSQITLIENCTSSQEIIKKLTSIYEQKSETNKMIVHERFHQYKMDVNDSIAQHISKVENLARQITEADEQISSAAIITKILNSLPIKYRSFRQAWLSLSDDKQTIVNLTARLLDEENCITAVQDLESALTVSKDIRNSGKYSNSQGSNMQRDKKNKSQVICFNCRKKGHISRFCVNKKRNKHGNEATNGSRGEGSYSSAFLVNMNNSQETNYLNIPFEVTDSDKWIMDSGASAHMTFRRDFFSTFETVDDDCFVTLW